MRTTRPRLPSSIRTLGLLSALSALSLALAGCPDALRLDPGLDGGPDGGAEGDGGVMRCDSNPDCVAPTAVCDAVQRQCVECLTVGDCAAKPGTVCSAGQCACENPDESACPRAGEGQPARCVDVKISPKDCGACGHTCFGACEMSTCAGGWEVTSLVDAPAGRSQHVAVWDEADGLMVVWGGALAPNKPTATGGLYDLAKNRWAATSLLNAPSPRQGATAVWDSADHVMIVWGGREGGGAFLNTGALFDPKANTWTPMATEGAPSPRVGHTAVWDDADKLMIIWGGTDATKRLGDGATFDPKTNLWAPLPATPIGSRTDHTAVWTGGTMRIWGGLGPSNEVPPTEVLLADGADYSPSAGVWSVLSSVSAPISRRLHTAIWTGKGALIWGGAGGKDLLGDGAKYEDTGWTALSADAAPEARNAHAAAWIPTTGEMIIWGGQGTGALLNSGARYSEASNTWKLLPTALSARSRPSAVVAGAKVILWGGDTADGTTNTGGIFDASAK